MADTNRDTGTTGAPWAPSPSGPRINGPYIELRRDTWVRANAIIMVDVPGGMSAGCRAWIPGYGGPTGLPTGRDNPSGVLFAEYALDQVLAALAVVPGR